MPTELAARVCETNAALAFRGALCLLILPFGTVRALASTTGRISAHVAFLTFDAKHLESTGGTGLARESRRLLEAACTVLASSGVGPAASSADLSVRARAATFARALALFVLELVVLTRLTGGAAVW